MIDILIWSKDRACQLDLCLRSIKENFNIDKQIQVLYKASNQDFENGFNLLKKKHNDIIYHKEIDFEKDTKRIINNFKNHHCIFFTDDDIFINKVDAYTMGKMVEICTKNQKIHTISFRMNPNINYCYPAKKQMMIPNFIKKKRFLLWNWQEQPDQHTCWGYPMSVNGQLFGLKLIKSIINRNSFYNVNSLEAMLNRNRFKDKPLLMSFMQTKVFNVQNNFVQGKLQDVIVDNNSIENLNKQFLDNNIISTENLYGIMQKSAHGAVNYIFKKDKERWNSYDESYNFYEKNNHVTIYGDTDKDILLIYEPFCIKPNIYDINNMRKYKAVITWNSKLYDILKNKNINVKLLKSFPMFNRNYNLDTFIPFEQKINGISLMCKKRETILDYDISELRIKTLLKINDHNNLICHCYGREKYLGHLYQGQIGKNNTRDSLPSSKLKLEYLNKYKFNLCYENCYHELWSWDFITEKLFDCFRAKTIPIYLGAYNIENIIPDGLYIDKRKYNTIEELINKLNSIEKNEYEDMTEKAFEFDKNNKFGDINELQNVINGIK